jgi:asparagine synthase (glutamine-hydrolysing)
MCGIAGILGLALDLNERQSILQAMLKRLTPRGPDEQVWGQTGAFGYAFTRLVVIDPLTGSQPFRDDSGQVFVFANGEIYNHHTLWREHLPDMPRRSQSDCGVVLGLFLRYGIDFAKYLDGMFAIAIWDGRTNNLHLIRDRFGIRPLVYGRWGGDFVFASEVKAILAHPNAPRRIDRAAQQVLPTRAYPYPRPETNVVTTFLEDVHHVLPGHILTISADGSCNTKAFWTAPSPGSASRGDPADRLHSLAQSSVNARLATDAKIGLFLSGGLDSAYLAGLAANAGRALDCFTLSTPELDEIGDTEAARLTSHEFGHCHHVLRLNHEAASAVEKDALEIMEGLVWIMDGPVFDVEILLKYHLHRAASARVPGLKSILLGQGADEFTGGYGALGASGFRDFIAREGGAGWQKRRFADLAAYNLWHEDRTAAANGLESRVPFLDHKIVEHLLSLDRNQWGFWFADKRILRLAARAVLPGWICWRRKTPFLPTMAHAKSVEATLLTALARGAALPFQTKYAASAETKKLLALADDDPVDADCARHALWAISCTIFEAQVRATADLAFDPPRMPSLDLLVDDLPPRTIPRNTRPASLHIAPDIDVGTTSIPRPTLSARRGKVPVFELVLAAAPRRSTPSDRQAMLDPERLCDWLGFSPSEAEVVRGLFLSHGLAYAVDKTRKPSE